VRHWLKKHRLSTAPAEQRRRRREARDAESSTVLERCHRHGLTEHYLDSSGHYRCKRCRTDAVIRRRRKVKQMLVIESGSRCRICGYDRYSGALEFHHLDPATKSFGLSVRGLTPSIATLRTEVQKCILLCSNCHAEVEGGISSISAVVHVGDPG